MHKGIKRGLAIAAVAPLAIVGFAGAASAMQTGSDTRTQNINSVGTSVDRCDGPGPLFFDVTIDRKGSGYGSNQYKIDSVTVNAPDNQGSDEYDNPFARVKSIQVQYRNASDETFKTSTSYATARHGGEVTFSSDVTAHSLKVVVSWYEIEDWDSASLKCSDIELPGSVT